MQICTLTQTHNHASTPPLSFLQAGCPSCRPANSIKALKGYLNVIINEWVNVSSGTCSPGLSCPGHNTESRKTVVCVCVLCLLLSVLLALMHFSGALEQF